MKNTQLQMRPSLNFLRLISWISVVLVLVAIAFFQNFLQQFCSKFLWNHFWHSLSEIQHCSITSPEPRLQEYHVIGPVPQNRSRDQA